MIIFKEEENPLLNSDIVILLKIEGIYTQYLDNLNYVNVNDVNRCKTIGEVLSRGFMWDTSSEGFHYWSSLHEKIKDIEI